MKFVCLSSKRYPSTTADGLFVAASARALHKVLGDRFLFVVSQCDDPSLFPGIPLFSLGFSRARLRSLIYFFKFLSLHKHLSKDTVIYSNEQPLVLVALLWRWMFGYRVVYEAHGFFHWRRDRFFLRLWCWWIDHVVATSDTLKGLLEGLEPKLAGRISVVRGGFDPLLVNTSFDRTTTREELGIAPGSFVVAYSGHFKTRGEKGLTTLLEAISRATPPITALLIGGKSDEIAEYRLKFPGTPVIYKEWTSDQSAVFGLLQVADALIIPTSRDTLYTRYSFPMKAYDYLAMGKPTIISDLPIIREVMTDQVAVVSEPGDSLSLARAINRLVIDGALRNLLGRNARELAQQYTWERRAEGIVEILRSTI